MLTDLDAMLRPLRRSTSPFAEEIPRLHSRDAVWVEPRLVADLLPVGLRGLALAGLIAVLMSSMSACYNSSATLVVRDFVMRAYKKAIKEKWRFYSYGDAMLIL